MQPVIQQPDETRKHWHAPRLINLSTRETESGTIPYYVEASYTLTSGTVYRLYRVTTTTTTCGCPTVS